MLSKTQFQTVLGSLWKIIQSCLINDPEKRPTADQLVKELASVCFSVYPRIRGITKSIVLQGGRSSFVQSDEGDALYHLDSYYKKGSLAAGELVAFSRHPGSPSARAL